MARKIFIVLCLCIAAISCVYAGKVDFLGQVSPYSVQTVSASSRKYVSNYGYGFKVGFRYETTEHFAFGLDASDTMFKFKELGYDYQVIALRAVAGYTYNFTEKLYANGELGLGFSFKSIGGKRQTTFGIGAYLGGGFRLSNDFAVTLGAELDFGLQSRSVDFAAKSQIGLLMSL